MGKATELAIRIMLPDNLLKPTMAPNKPLIINIPIDNKLKGLSTLQETYHLPHIISMKDLYIN